MIANSWNKDKKSLVLTKKKRINWNQSLKSTSAKWVYGKDASNNPKIDLDAWPDDVPFMEVVSQFNDELEKFRTKGNTNG
jgi:hypothetical protein